MSDDTTEWFVPNLTGKNQHNDCHKSYGKYSLSLVYLIELVASSNNKWVAEILQEYHCWNLTSKKLISKLLLAEHGIQMRFVYWSQAHFYFLLIWWSSEATVTCCWRLLDLYGSWTTTHALPVTVKCQLILDQMSKDPARCQGLDLIKEGIAFDQGVHISHDFVTAEMCQHDPAGFKIQDPMAKKISCQPLVALSPHHKWSGDGHDKLLCIGFPIWGIHDKWSRKWLGLWVVPNNPLKTMIAYLYLTTIESVGGMPFQTMTDCRSETTQVFGLANALWYIIL